MISATKRGDVRERARSHGVARPPALARDYLQDSRRARATALPCAPAECRSLGRLDRGREAHAVFTMGSFCNLLCLLSSDLRLGSAQ